MRSNEKYPLDRDLALAMHALMLTIKGKGIGRCRAIFDDFSIPPPVSRGDGGPFSLLDLITHVVHQEVAAFEDRRDARRLDRVLFPG